MRVALYRNYREEQQPSMRIYADMLARHLPRVADVDVAQMRPHDVVPRALRELRVVAKLGDFSGRYLAPLAGRLPEVDIHHVIDHGSSHLLARLPRERTVVTCHDLVPLLTARGRLPRTHVPVGARLIFRGIMAMLPRARLILTDSESTQRDLVRELGCDPRHIRVVHLGLQDEHLAPWIPQDLLEAEVRLRLGPRPRILSEGVNWPHKNLDGVLDAFAFVKRRAETASLVRVGAPFSPTQALLVERLGLATSVHELGRISVRDLAATYRLCDVLLFPSYYEGFGWPPLEAMAAGLPVVASPCGALPEISGDAPLFAPPSEPRRLADQALRFLEDAELRGEHVRRGREIAARYRWSETARATADAYRWVLES